MDVDELTLRADRALAELHQRGLNRKNLFWMAKVAVDEDQWSDVLAHLLAPGERHGLGTLALVTLRELLARQGESPARLRALDLAITSPPSTLCITRELEVGWTRTRPDIVIERPDGDRLTICIENKKLNGVETTIGGLPQAQRQERWLQQRESEGHAVLGILLTPGERPPSSSAFVRLSTGKFVRAMRDTLLAKPAENIHTLAFLELIESTHT